MCFEFIKNSYCKFGDKCYYLHDNNTKYIQYYNKYMEYKLKG